MANMILRRSYMFSVEIGFGILYMVHIPEHRRLVSAKFCRARNLYCISTNSRNQILAILSGSFGLVIADEAHIVKRSLMLVKWLMN
jgi:hypothetical protein